MAYNPYTGRVFASGPSRFDFRYEEYALRFGHEDPPETWEEAKRRGRQYRIAALADELAFAHHGLCHLRARISAGDEAAADELGPRLRRLCEVLVLLRGEVNGLGDARSFAQLLALAAAAATTPGLWTPDPEEERAWRRHTDYVYEVEPPLSPASLCRMSSAEYEAYRRARLATPPERGLDRRPRDRR